MDYKIVLGAIAVIISFIGYIPYYRDVLKGLTKPHAFSWLGWAILEGIGFIAQINQHAGAGAWVTGFGVLATLGIFYLSLRHGEKDIKLLDWIAFIAGVIAIVLWQVTKNPLTAVILVTVADACLFVPTYRKAWIKPNEETLIEYFFSAIKWTVGILALQHYNATTWLYPASLILTNSLFVFLISLRRRKLVP